MNKTNKNFIGGGVSNLGQMIQPWVTEDFADDGVKPLLDWIRTRNQEVSVSVEPVPFLKVKGWHFDSASGNLVHDSGRFFSIVGLDVFVNNGRELRWNQPVVNQPEVGYLGFLAKEFDGVMHVLGQAKIEPGNVNHVQLSPTIQATRSNYMQVHGGRAPAYIDYFKNATPPEIVLDQLQSEQGARFYRKRNRNMIVRVVEDIPLLPDFRWITLAQIKKLMRYDNVVNMDTRTVISGLSFSSVIHDGEDASSLCSNFGKELLFSESRASGVRTMDDILHWITELKSKYELVVDKIPLKDVLGWMVSETEIVRADRKFFRVIGVNVSIDNREVKSWCQPLVEPMQDGLCVLFMKRIHGVLHFLLQAKIECGNFDVVELAPTIQCLTGDYTKTHQNVAYLSDFFDGKLTRSVHFDTLQSEEGGRFYHEQNRNVIIEVSDDFDENVSEWFCWMTLGQIKEFLRFNNYLNIQVRSLISALDYT